MLYGFSLGSIQMNSTDKSYAGSGDFGTPLFREAITVSGRGVNFRHFHERLTQNLRDRVRSGEVTERGLARLTQVSQPHIHHVLKGKRLLSPDMADKVLQSLHIDLLDLVEPRELLEWRLRR
jgi:hypothetical protein